MSNNLFQDEADQLLKMQKMKVDDKEYEYPIGGNLSIPIISADEREQFILDISRGRIEFKRNKFQTRARKTVILARIDLNGAPHRNPDNEEIDCPHLHVYREGYDDKWAYPLPDSFKSPHDFWETLQDFMEFCKIMDRPNIKKGLFT